MTQVARRPGYQVADTTAETQSTQSPHVSATECDVPFVASSLHPRTYRTKQWPNHVPYVYT